MHEINPVSSVPLHSKQPAPCYMAALEQCEATLSQIVLALLRLRSCWSVSSATAHVLCMEAVPSHSWTALLFGTLRQSH